MRQKVKEGGKRGISINMLVFILGILICASLLTYIIPAGQFDVNPETKALIPGTYHAVEQTPVNLWNALRNIFTGMTNSAKVMSIVIFMGGALKVIISTGGGGGISQLGHLQAAEEGDCGDCAADGDSVLRPLRLRGK